MHHQVKIVQAAIFVFTAGLAAAAGLASIQYKSAASARLVSNPVKPRDGIVTPKITELWSVGGENDPSGELLSQPFEVQVAGDGTVFVLDWGDTCIRVYDDKGKFIRRIGRKGQGPGDMETPSWFDIDAAGNISLTDSRNMRVSRFDREGKFISSFRLEKFATQIRVDRSGRIYLAEDSSGTPELTSTFTKIQRILNIVRCDKDGKNPARIGPFQAEVMLMKTAGESMISLSSPDAPQTGWGIAPDGRLWVGHNGTYEIGVYDPDGNPLFRFGREYIPVKIKIAKVSMAENRKTMGLSEFFPAFVPDFFFDEAGNAWFRMYRNEGDEDKKKEPYRYDVFSPEGIYLKQIVVPFHVYQVRNGKMYAIVESEEGFKILKCFRFE